MDEIPSSELESEAVSCDSGQYMAKACAYWCQHHLWRHAGIRVSEKNRWKR